MIRSNWVYMIMWISKDIVLTNRGTRLEKDNRIIESKVLDILDQLACDKLNSQVKTFLRKFRQFQEISLDPGVDDEEEVQTFEVENEFQNIFEDKESEHRMCELKKFKKR